jgi:transposase
VAIIAEIGIDMTVFGNAKRLAAWAGVCPQHRSSCNFELFIPGSERTSLG